MIKDLRPGPDGLDNGQLLVFGALGSRVLFRADVDAAFGPELYRTDATKAGTGLVKDIKPGRRWLAAWHPVRRFGTASATSPPTTAPTGTSCGARTAPRAGTRMVKDIGAGRRNDVSAYLWGKFRGDLVVAGERRATSTASTAASCGGATAPRQAPRA